jgi:hypothetical protein
MRLTYVLAALLTTTSLPALAQVQVNIPEKPSANAPRPLDAGPKAGKVKEVEAPPPPVRISKKEFMQPMEDSFNNMDKNRDGYLSEDEMGAADPLGQLTDDAIADMPTPDSTTARPQQGVAPINKPATSQGSSGLINQGIAPINR